MGKKIVEQDLRFIDVSIKGHYLISRCYDYQNNDILIIKISKKEIAKLKPNYRLHNELKDELLKGMTTLHQGRRYKQRIQYNLDIIEREVSRYSPKDYKKIDGVPHLTIKTMKQSKWNKFIEQWCKVLNDGKKQDLQTIKHDWF